MEKRLEFHTDHVFFTDVFTSYIPDVIVVHSNHLNIVINNETLPYNKLFISFISASSIKFTVDEVYKENCNITFDTYYFNINTSREIASVHQINKCYDNMFYHEYNTISTHRNVNDNYAIYTYIVEL